MGDANNADVCTQIHGIAGGREHTGVNDRCGRGVRLDLGSSASELPYGESSKGKPGEANAASHPGRGKTCGNEREGNQEI